MREACCIKHHLGDEQHLMANGPVVAVDVLHHEGRAWNFHLDLQLLDELAFERILPALAKLHAAAQRAHPCQTAFVIGDLGGQQFAIAPVQAEGLDFDVLGWSPGGGSHACFF